MKNLKTFESHGISTKVIEMLRFILKSLKNLKTTNEYNFDLNQYLSDTKLKLTINITYESKESYDAHINFYEILKNGFNNSHIKINIKTKHLNFNFLSEALEHELHHLYELHTINKFIEKSDWYYQKNLIDFKRENTNVGEFIYFLDIIYSSFDHELRSKISQLYGFLLTSQSPKDEDGLLYLMKKSRTYQTYQNLLKFDYKFIINYYKQLGNINILINFVNLLNKKFNKVIINNEHDLQEYLKKWQYHFRDSAKKMYKKMLKVVYKVFVDINKEIENMDYYLYSEDIVEPIYFDNQDIQYINYRIDELLLH